MVRRSAVPTAKAITFFAKHAGYAARSGESRAQAKRRAGKALARAEAEASARGWRVEWEGDPELPDHDIADYEPKEVLGAVLRDQHGHVLASLWGIMDPSRNYARVIEAELALEALGGK
jgi:hypothetical protein